MREEQLGQTNREQVSKIMDPLNETFRQMKEQMQKMEESVQKVNTDSAERKASITQTIEALAKETIKVGEQAGDLAKALKNKSKVQGDWGEQVLENILEGSGLRKDEDYYTQYNVKGEGNANFRPDVVVKCPGDKSIVIDSKVSLTAYLDYVAADDPDSQKKAARENLASIRKHIDELSAKNYEKLVGNTISHVLMFIPNEGSYILALQTDPKIAQYAFSKNVLLINPTNLMMSLKLIYNIWQSERQTRNVENIVAESTGLYEKFAGFLETFTDVGTKIQSLQKAFDTAENQLCTGKGNVVRRIEGLKEKGILPKKSLPDKYLNKARE
jgi:DNA recombination protein RmuC